VRHDEHLLGVVHHPVALVVESGERDDVLFVGDADAQARADHECYVAVEAADLLDDAPVSSISELRMGYVGK